MREALEGRVASSVNGRRSSTRGGEPLLAVEDLAVGFDGLDTALVDGVWFTLERGETLCLVGESGCGKTVTALALMGLLPRPPARILRGRARFAGHELFAMTERELADLRGDRIAMIFQEPMTSLNPAFRIGDQIAEAVLRHRPVSRAGARTRALELLKRVRIPAPE
ncbi:MAG TPA: ATP-binding cassette domain-containing protein, partial [Burkholderiales bacterium]|nr:ATP-binding cassette domain-containing protein [Burkholderiales bacterium]